eukprot:scaffold128777_cov24-Tisochrysis_lutea.AAC.1
MAVRESNHQQICCSMEAGSEGIGVKNCAYAGKARCQQEHIVFLALRGTQAPAYVFLHTSLESWHKFLDGQLCLNLRSAQA